MIKLSNQQIKALAAKIMQDSRASVIIKQEEEREQFLSDKAKEIDEYLNACESLEKARKCLIDTWSIESYSLNSNGKFNREYTYDNVVKSIKVTWNKLQNTDDIANEILILSIDAETVWEIMAHFNTL